MKKKGKKIGILGLILIDIIVAGCFFLTYGPVSFFRDFLVTTAMTSMTHKYLARTFYSEKMIQKVLSQNTIEMTESSTDTSKIIIGGETDGYASVYEKEILDHKKNEDYKLIEFEYNGYDCYLVAIYDPSRVSIAQTSYLGVQGEVLRNIAKKNNAKVAINAGGFVDPNGEGNGGTPMGPVIQNSKIAWGNENDSFEMVGFNKDNILVLKRTTVGEAIKDGIRDAVNFGPYLIVNGVSAKINGNGGWGINPRTAIAQRKDGIVLFLVIDGNGQNRYNWSGRGGVTLSELIEILERYGAYNDANMDGGASTNLVINNELYNNPCAISETGERWLPNGWIMK